MYTASNRRLQVDEVQAWDSLDICWAPSLCGSDGALRNNRNGDYGLSNRLLLTYFYVLDLRVLLVLRGEKLVLYGHLEHIWLLWFLNVPHSLLLNLGRHTGHSRRRSTSLEHFPNYAERNRRLKGILETRYLVKLIIEVAMDMESFLHILAYSLLTFSVAYYCLSNNNDTRNSFGEELAGMWRLT